MKIPQIKYLFILLATSFITIFGLSNCGQNSSTKIETITDSATQVVETPATIPDSQATITTQENIESTESKKQEVNSSPEAAKKPGEQTVVAKKKSTTNTNVPVTNNPTVIPPQKAPVVVVNPEPAKPVPEPQPKVVEAPKPVVVAPAPEQNAWPVPAKYKSMTNPYPINKESIALGKSLYSLNCKSCHGTRGEGDGTKAATLETKIGSFQSASFKAEKPGEVFYKISKGRKDMPKFEKKIPDDEDRWALVNYIMNF